VLSEKEASPAFVLDMGDGYSDIILMIPQATGKADRHPFTLGYPGI
jgi:hypothetical protein